MWKRSSKHRKSSNDGQIISEESLWAVKQVAKYIKEHSRTAGIFRMEGRDEVRCRILSSLQRGDPDTRLRLQEAPVESAAALVRFITGLRVPLIPPLIQRLIMAENKDVPVHQIACDALGLLRQDLSGRHLTLVSVLLDMLHVVCRNCRNNSEMFVCNLPVVFLPVFFTMESSDVERWKDLATTFSEVISTAPDWLTRCDDGGDDSATLLTTPRQAAGFIDDDVAGRFLRVEMLRDVQIVNVEQEVGGGH